MNRLKINLDTLGISTSLACAIHCALLPLFFTSVPVLGVELIDNTTFETLMIFIAFLIGGYSLYHGYKKHHHRILPLVVFIIGASLLFAKQLWHQYQLQLLVPAVICIVTAHYINFRNCKKANHCHASDCAH